MQRRYVSFLVCIHDATPAHAGETRVMIRDLAPLVGRRLSVGVVPDWQGRWPLAAHRDYCRFIKESADELLLHGYCHQRRRGCGPVTLLAERGDEMNGLDAGETRRTLERGQRVFADVFGERARGFLPPAWQRGYVRPAGGDDVGLEHVLGFFGLESHNGAKIPLATLTWDCGRWRWLAHVGERIGPLLRSWNRGVPALAIHPRDLERGFWPRILRKTRELLDEGCEPVTPAALLERRRAEADV